MNKSLKRLVIIIILLLITIPVIINILFKFDFEIWWFESEWSAGDALNFYGVILTFIGTISLGLVSIWQTKKSNEMNERIINKELLENYCFALVEKCELGIKHNNDCKITHSAHHKYDNGSTILIEEYDPKKVKKLNEYYIKLLFKNKSKTLIKNIKIISALCVQEPSKDGMYWEPDSNNPIPQGLSIDRNEDIQVNWISDEEFFIHMKIYSPTNGCISNMIENQVPFCLMLKLELESLTGVSTTIQYKIWLTKSINEPIEITRTNANVISQSISN